VKTGTYQQYITSPAKYLSPIPDGVPDEIAAVGTIASIGLQKL
jgi:NADPH:quinone reductase-like Zn-dependent oxidoreductase